MPVAPVRSEASVVAEGPSLSEVSGISVVEEIKLDAFAVEAEENLMSCNLCPLLLTLW